MKVGTKSVLFGAHCFLIHPFFVLISWWKLYGFPWDPRLWIAFFVHDLGYLGKPNMDGDEGETHVELGAKIMSIFDYKYIIRNIHTIYRDYPYYTKRGYKEVYSIGEFSLIMRNTKNWSNFSRYHSRFYAKKENVQPSKLCFADKYAICLEPSWLYLPRVNWTGEIHEYMKLAESRNLAGEPQNRYESMKLTTKTQKDWFQSVKSYLTRWVEEHIDVKVDTWTPNLKEAKDNNGVWK